MKFCETKFEEYIKKFKQNNLHPELEDIYSGLPNTITEHPNLVFYGPSGIGKYTQALQYISNFSPTKLKYERKITYKYNNKYEYTFKLSDVHFEIDM